MAPRPCPRHPGNTAEYRCDGCGEPLCEECIERGHRLLFCKLCGERALPLEGAPAAAAAQAHSGSFVERRRAAVARSAEGYGLSEALAYPLRGLGGYLFWGFVVILLLLDLVESSLPMGAGMVTLVPSIVLALLVPAFLFKITNSTAQGRDELPDWPDFDVWSLVRSFLLFAGTTLFCLLPTFLFLWLAGCGPMRLFAGETSLGACFLAIVAGFAVGVALWVPAFGSTALYDTFGAFFRLDMHVEAMLVSPRQLALTTALLAGLLIARTVLMALFSVVPLVGGVLGTAIGVYTLFMGPHLVGVFFRRHWGELERIYLG